MPPETSPSVFFNNQIDDQNRTRTKYKSKTHQMVHKQHKTAIIALSNTSAKPFAMVIKPIKTTFANRAVETSQRTHQVACFTLF